MKLDEGPPSDASVVQGLAALKRKGGTVLVVGAAGLAHVDVCRRFLTSESDGENVLVCTDGSVQTKCLDPAPAAIIERSVPMRSATASTSVTFPDLGSIVQELQATMSALAGEESSLRVCFDSLRPFVDTTDETTLVSVLDSLREVARETDALVHIHLAAMPDSIPPVFFENVDAVVEVIRQGEATYQQWYLPGASATTSWTEI